MSRVPAEVWPFGSAAAAKTYHRFENERDVRVAVASEITGFVLLLAAALLWSFPASALCVVAAIVTIVGIGAWNIRHAEDPSPAVSAERSLRLGRVFWVAELLQTVVVAVAVIVAVG